MKTYYLFIFTALFAAPAFGQDYPREGDPTFNGARIQVQDDIDLPAQEEGTLIKLLVREGSRVKKGDVIATIDDRQVQAARKVAKISLDAALERVKDDIEERYAMAAADVAETDYLQDMAAVRDTAHAVSKIQLRKKKLDWKRAELQIEKAQKDKVLAQKEADVKQAELEAADLAVTRRTIYAPFDGNVQTLYRHQSEWVKPGEPILRLLRLDTMHVECFVSSREFDPVDVAGKPVTVDVELARGRKASFQGKVVFVSQSVQSDGEYLIRAEVANERVGDYWLIRPGLQASITIHLKDNANSVSQTEISNQKS